MQLVKLGADTCQPRSGEIGLTLGVFGATIVRWGRLIDTLILKLSRPVGQAAPFFAYMTQRCEQRLPSPASTEAAPCRGPESTSAVFQGLFGGFETPDQRV